MGYNADMGMTFYQRRMQALEALGTVPARKDTIDRFKEKVNIEIYNCSKWHKVRNRMMALIPCCPDPFGQHGDRAVQSEEVHHIVPIKANPALAYSLANLVPLCRSCHKMADNLDMTDPIRQRNLLGSIRIDALGIGDADVVDGFALKG